MIAEIREKRKHNFSYKIIEPSLIRKFADIFQQQATALDAKGVNDYLLVFSLDATDNSSYESRSSAIYGEQGIIEKKEASRVSMQLQTLSNDKNLQLQISQTAIDDKTQENFIAISGNDSIWVNGVLSQFTELISSAKPQSTIGNYIGYYVLAAWVLFTTLYFHLTYPLQNMKGIRGLTYASIPFLVGFYPFKYIAGYLEKLWPSMELQSGPDHQRLPAIKRKKLNWIIASIVLPLLIALTYDLLKTWLIIH